MDFVWFLFPGYKWNFFVGEKVHKTSLLFIPLTSALPQLWLGSQMYIHVVKSCEVKRKNDSFSMKSPGKKSPQNKRDIRSAAEFWPDLWIMAWLRLCLSMAALGWAFWTNSLGAQVLTSVEEGQTNPSCTSPAGTHSTVLEQKQSWMWEDWRNPCSVPAMGEAGEDVCHTSRSFLGQRHKVNRLWQSSVDKSTFWNIGHDLQFLWFVTSVQTQAFPLCALVKKKKKIYFLGSKSGIYSSVFTITTLRTASSSWSQRIHCAGDMSCSNTSLA